MLCYRYVEEADSETMYDGEQDNEQEQAKIYLAVCCDAALTNGIFAGSACGLAGWILCLHTITGYLVNELIALWTAFDVLPPGMHYAMHKALYAAFVV